MRLQIQLLAKAVILFFVVGVSTAIAQETEEATRSMVGSDAAEGSGYSSWDIQYLYGTDFHEPFNPYDVSKSTMTIENSTAWSWGSSYFFIDTLYSSKNDLDMNGNEVDAWEGYAEWYPSASISKMTGTNLSVGILKDVSVTTGLNIGRKSTGANPLVYVPGLTFDFSLPGFAFFSLGTYAYIDRGEINNGVNNGCHSTGFQLTPSWLVPFSVGNTDFQFSGFADYITEHGDCKAQVLSQPQLTIDVGKMAGTTPGKFYAGVEYQYWNNKFGIDGLDEHFPEVMGMYRF